MPVPDDAERCSLRRWHEPGEECLGHGPVPGTKLPCGCYRSRVDYSAVLCDEHEAEITSLEEAQARYR